MLKFFKNNFNNAKILDNFAISIIIRNDFLQQLPNETWFQTTNLQENIAFGGNLKAELIDCCETVVKDITENFFFNEFTDEFGIKQINFEFGNVNIDFWTKDLHLKLSHTQSDNIWYSNSFQITNYQSQLTERFDYKNDTDLYFQSVRFKIYKNDFDVKSEVKTYTQNSGNIISLKPTNTEITKLRMDLCDNFYFNSLVKIFNKDLVYLSGQKISDKPQIKKGERIGGSNIFILDTEINLTHQIKIFQSQLFQDYKITPITPLGKYSLNSGALPNVTASFNRLTVVGIGNLKIYNSLNVLVQSFNQSEMTIVNNVLTISTAIINLAVGKYYINFDATLFFGLEINNTTDWTFEIESGQFKPNQFKPNQFK